ncbi:helix-turn-helix transcriptional regulator [Nocardia transvalensis]|nr:helix-turn-helix transcriptional regulator [Nocardia transvalensis]
MTAERIDRLTRYLCGAVEEGAGVSELGAAISRGIAPGLAHDAVNVVASGTTCTRSQLSFGFSFKTEPGFRQAQVRHYFTEDEPHLIAEMAARPVPVDIVGAGSGGGTVRDRELLTMHGIGSSLRLLLCDSRGAWGVLELLRSQGGRPFDDEDSEQAARLTPALLAVLRRYVTAGPLLPEQPPPLPGVIVVGADDTIRAATSQGWLGHLRTGEPVPGWMAESVMTGLARQARKKAVDPNTAPALLVGPSATFGRWIAIHGQLLSGGDPGDVAIVVQAASGDVLLSAICGWYEITGRERQILEHLRTGAATKQIARALGLSIYTVNDHLKAIYRKTRAEGRDTLIAALS